MASWIFISSALAAVCGILFYGPYMLGWFSLSNANESGFPPDFHQNASNVTNSPTIPISSWSIAEHLGGHGPWITKTTNIVDGGIEPPDHCYVDQVHMLSRHGERYPTMTAGNKLIDFLGRMADSKTPFQGDLAFINSWVFFTNDPEDDFDNLVSIGPFAGTLQAFSAGVKLRSRYSNLLQKALSRKATAFWAADSRRVIDSARYFGAGFFGIDWERVSNLFIVSEDAKRGANTLTPGRTCLRYYNNTDDFGHDYGHRMMAAFRKSYEPTILSRLRDQNSGFQFSDDDVFHMQSLCAFDTIVRGSSPWCNVFTHEEMEHFEYARDVLHFYRAGPGNPYSLAMGWLWLNATANLLEKGSAVGPLFLSFVHDSDIVPVLHALDLFPQLPDLPTSNVLHNRTWRTSDVVPMGGRLIIERLIRPTQRCWDNAPLYPNHVYCDPEVEEIFVRININDGVVAIPRCNNGPGSSCPLEDFLKLVQKRGSQVERFEKVCGMSEAANERITFLHQ